MSKPRFDFYQTNTSLTVSVFVKGAKEEDVNVTIGERSLSVQVKLPSTGAETALVIDPLFSNVNKEASSYKVYATKIDVVLDKASPGVHWKKLEADGDSIDAGTTPAYTSIASSSSAASSDSEDTVTPAGESSSRSSKTENPPKRHFSKWDMIKLEEEEAGHDEINAFFQKLYADADEDSKRAMLKSYQESAGTALSTDWSKVAEGRVKVMPPEGLEAKRWKE